MAIVQSVSEEEGEDDDEDAAEEEEGGVGAAVDNDVYSKGNAAPSRVPGAARRRDNVHTSL